MESFKTLNRIAFCFFMFPAFVLAQTAKIDGFIKDKDGKPLEAANVGILNTTLGNTTSANGYFVIENVPGGVHSVKVSIVGYESRTMKVNVGDNETETIQVTLQQQDQLLKEVTITSTGIKDEIKDVPGTVSVIDGRQIQESGAQSVGQIISRIPGVNYLDEDGRGLKPNIGLRGLDPIRNRNILVLIDGKFPIGMTLYGDPAAYYMIPLQQVDRIEVIKGASPVLYGGYSVGGVINMITKRGLLKPETKADIGYGSYNTLQAQISTGGEKKNFNYYISGLRRQGDGFRDRSDFAVNDYTVRLGSRLDSASELSVYLNMFTEDSESPGGLTKAQYENDPTQSQHTSDQFYSQRFSGAISYKTTVNQYHTFSTSLYGNYFKRDWWLSYTNPVSTGYLRDIHAIGNVTDYNLTKSIAGHENSLIVGFRIHTDRLDDINVAGANKESRTGNTTGNKINTSFIYEAFVYDEFGISPNFSFAPGIRYTNVKYKRNDMLYKNGEGIVVGRQDEITSDAFVYSAGFIYKMEDHSRIYATVSKGYQPPSLNATLAPTTIDAGVDLEPETSMNYEIGIRTAPVSWLGATIAAYRMDFENKVITESGINRNAGDSYHRGIEAEIELGVWNGLSMFLNGTIQKATFSSGENDGNILPNAPQRLAAAGIRYKVLFGDQSLIFNVSHNYVGKQYTDAKNTAIESEDGKVGPVPSYHVSNFTANYNRKNWGLYLNVNNVFDEKYFTLRLAGQNGIIPSPDRNFMAGVTYKF